MDSRKALTLGAALLGLALATGAVVWLGAGQIFHAILRIGWLGLVYVVVWQLFVFVLLGTAWWMIGAGAPLWVMIGGRLVREGGENCLPFSEIGGLLFGARAIMLQGVDFAKAGASSVLDVMTEGIGLVPFLLFGLVMLLATKPDSGLVLPMGLGLGLLLLGGLGVGLARRRISTWLRQATTKMLRHWDENAPDKGEALQRALDTLSAQRGRLAGAALLHALCWCGGGGNVWIAYHLLGAKPSLLDALAIESLLSGVLAIGFLIPAGAGVQELTYVGVGSLFGMPPHLSLALSLIRRARDIIIGAPCLLVWQALEARQLKKE